MARRGRPTQRAAKTRATPSPELTEDYFASLVKAKAALAAIDRSDVARAAAKKKRGEPLRREERSLLDRYAKAIDEIDRWKHYRAVPQKHIKDLYGAQTKQLNEQAERYGLAFGGAVVDLAAFFRSLRDFFGRYGRQLAQWDDDLLGGENSPALERYREEKAKLARLDRLERERNLLPRSQVHDVLTRMASLLRGAGDTLQRQFGPDALGVLHEALDDVDRELTEFLGDTHGDDVDGSEGR